MTLTLELPEPVQAQLEADARAQGRPVADVLAAILAERYAAEPLDAEAIAAIHRGLDDIDAGRTMTLEDYEARMLASRRARAEAAA